MTPAQKERLRDAIADRLVDMESMFDSRCKLSFVMRSPHLPDGDVVVTNDNIEAVIGALQRLKTYTSIGGHMPENEIAVPTPEEARPIDQTDGGDGTAPAAEAATEDAKTE